MSEQPRRRRRIEEAKLNENSFEDNLLVNNDSLVPNQGMHSEKSNEIEKIRDTRVSDEKINRHSSSPTICCPKCGVKVLEKNAFCGRCGYIINKTKRTKYRIKKTICILLFTLVAMLLLTALLSMGGDSENLIKRTVWMVNPTTAPTIEPTPTTIPTPVVEYVYITPKPMPKVTPEIKYEYLILTPKPMPKITPKIEYVYVTPKPTPIPAQLDLNQSYTIRDDFGKYSISVDNIHFLDADSPNEEMLMISLQCTVENVDFSNEYMEGVNSYWIAQSGRFSVEETDGFALVFEDSIYEMDGLYDCQSGVYVPVGGKKRIAFVYAAPIGTKEVVVSIKGIGEKKFVVNTNSTRNVEKTTDNSISIDTTPTPTPNPDAVNVAKCLRICLNHFTDVRGYGSIKGTTSGKYKYYSFEVKAGNAFGGVVSQTILVQYDTSNEGYYIFDLSAASSIDRRGISISGTEFLRTFPTTGFYPISIDDVKSLL